jgi:hypothetical protein
MIDIGASRAGGLYSGGVGGGCFQCHKGSESVCPTE